MASLVMILIFLAFMLLGVPVCAAMGVAAFAGLLMLDLPLDTFSRYILHDVKSVPLLAIPFFILAGNLMNSLGLTQRIFDFMDQLVGIVRGGLAQVTVLSSVVFAGISGSALADIAGLGTMQIHAMKRAGYRESFAAALVIASSLLAPIIPPSIMFILYAVYMNVSVGHMFVAGILPGLAMAAILLANNVMLERTGLEKFPPSRRSSWREILSSGWRGLPALLTPVVILRSMATGLVTPTEASVLAVCYAVLLGVLYRNITLEKLGAAFMATIRTTTLIMFLTGIGSVMAFVLTSERSAEQLSQALVSFTDNKWMVLCLACLAMLILGCFLETVPALLISVPLFGPLVVGFGIDPIHFGVVLTYVLLLGIVHPPVGLGIFAVCAVTKLRIEPVVRATLLFYPAFLVILFMLIFVPSMSTWLPSVVFARP
jgi:tripartite ATP-independent transporter DctM subunit